MKSACGATSTLSTNILYGDGAEVKWKSGIGTSTSMSWIYISLKHSFTSISLDFIVLFLALFHSWFVVPFFLVWFNHVQSYHIVHNEIYDNWHELSMQRHCPYFSLFRLGFCYCSLRFRRHMLQTINNLSL